MSSAPRFPRVLAVEPAGQLYGSERVLLDTLDGIAALPWTVGVCLPGGTPLVGHLKSRPVAVFPTLIGELHRRGKPARVAAAVGLLGAGLRFHPDLLYVNQAGATRLALVVARVLGVPVVTHVRLSEDVAYLNRLAPSKQALPSAICVSDSLRSLFTPGSPIGPGQLATLYDPFSLPPLPVNASALDGTPRFVCIGRLAQQKGQDVLLRGWQIFSRAVPEATLVFVGAAAAGDPSERLLQDLADELGVSPEWAGFDPTPARFLHEATALVCPSRYEPLGRVVFEAWAAGTVPIVWAGSGGAAEIVRASGAGIVYDEQTGESLADALQRAAALSPDERAHKIRQGQAWVREHCDPHAYASALTSIWSRALGTGA